MYQLDFDGLFKKDEFADHHFLRPGFMAYGWIIFRNGNLIARGHGVFAQRDHAASNLAEYLALIEGLEALVDLKVRDEPLLVRGDAKCVIDQMSDRSSVTSMPTLRLYRRAMRLSQHFTHLTWEWIPRNENRLADLLSRHAFKIMSSCTEFTDTEHRFSYKHGGLIPVSGLRVYQR
jgi:ribonuclease HI